MIKKNDTNARIIINFLIRERGYDVVEAKDITQKLFDSYEYTPSGMTLTQAAERVVPAYEYRKEYR